MPTIETYYYYGITYTWHHEPQNEYSVRHISIRSTVLAINECVEPKMQDWFEPPRWEHIGHSDAGIVTVITDYSETRIITAWHSSTEEVKEWLRQH